MNINISYLADYGFSIFKENIISSSRDQKIVLIALLALGYLAIVYWIEHCSLKGKTDSEKNSEATQRIAFLLKEDFDELANDGKQAQSAHIFIKMQFDQNKIKKEFIIGKLSKDPFDPSFMVEQAEKIRQCIEKNIEEGFGDWNNFQVVTIFKNPKNVFYKASHERPSGWDSINYWDLSKEKIDITYEITITDKMGFPKEKHIENQEFVPGTFYQALD